MTAITAFRIDISDEAIADLHERLTMARWPQQIATDWSRGQPVAFVRELAEQWRDRFDWRKDPGLRRGDPVTADKTLPQPQR